MFRNIDIPLTLGAWDRRTVEWMAEGRAEHDRERNALIEQNVDDLERIISKEGLHAPVFFAKRKNHIKATKAIEMLGEAVDEGDFKDRLLTLVFHASEGSPLAGEYAKELRAELIRQAATSEADAVDDPVSAARRAGL